MFDHKKYDEYLEEHIDNVKKAYNLLVKEGIFEEDEITESIINEHDKSKYDKEEYYPYGEYFYGDKKDVEHKDDIEFQNAWLHHQHHNPHHWQHWLLKEDENKELIALEMPKKYVKEMICDWLSFSIKSGDLQEIHKWYKENKKKQILHEKTRELVEKYLEKIKEIKEVEEIFNLK